MYGLFSCDTNYKYLHGISYDKNVLEKMTENNYCIEKVVIFKDIGDFFAENEYVENEYFNKNLNVAVKLGNVINSEKVLKFIAGDVCKNKFFCYSRMNKDVVILFSQNNLEFIEKNREEFSDFSNNFIELDKYYEEGCMNA